MHRFLLDVTPGKELTVFLLSKFYQFQIALIEICVHFKHREKNHLIENSVNSIKKLDKIFENPVSGND